mgnify:CR=1 FL=1
MADEMTPSAEGQESKVVDTKEEGSTLLTQPEEQPTQPETQDPSEKPAEGEQDAEKKEGEEGKKSDLPETYEIKLQEGFTLSSEQQAEVDTMFKDMGLTSEQGQRLADYYMDKMKAEQDRITQEYLKRQEAEVAAVKADKEIGGAALKETLGYARQAMDKFGGETFRRELEAHGMGNNVEMIRLLARVGRAMQGDSLVVGSNGGQSKDGAHILYPNLK